MPHLTDYVRHADAHAHFSKAALWDLFDGNRERLNIGHECVDRHDPGRVAIRIADADGSSEEITFGALATWSNRFATYLRDAGVGPGERVAIMLEPSLAFYAALFGAMKSGAVAVPMFTLFGPDGIRLRLDDCDPALFLATDEHAGMAEEKPGRRIEIVDDAFMDRVAAASDRFVAETAADDMAMFQYTSGTTRALPDAVRHRHRAIVTVMIAALYGTGVRPTDRFMCPSSPAWGHGLWHGTLAPLAMGASIATYRGRFDPARLLASIEEFGITNMSAAATHYRMMRGLPGSSDVRVPLEKATFTGEPIDSETARWAERAFATPIASMYGTTEVGVILVNYPGADDFEIREGSLGKPVPGIEVAVVDAAGKPVPPGTRGEIVLRRGDNWFPTKDLGETDADGYFYHRGRADDVIISAGWTMSAVEIEDVLMRHQDVREVAVIASPDEERGQIAKAFVVSGRAGDAAFEDELKGIARERLSRHEYPRAIAFVDSLPKLPAGKIDRKALREQEKRKREDNPA